MNAGAPPLPNDPMLDVGHALGFAEAGLLELDPLRKPNEHPTPMIMAPVLFSVAPAIS